MNPYDLEWSPNAIALVGAMAAEKIPDNGTLHFTELRKTAEQIRAALSGAGAALDQVDRNVDLNLEAKSRYRREVGVEQMKVLDKIAIVPSSVNRRIEKLQSKMRDELRAASGELSDSIAAEIRAHIKAAGGIKEVLRLNDATVTAAVLAAPAVLSGLRPDELQLLRDRAERATTAGAELAEIKNAEKILGGAMRAARAKLARRTGMSQNAEGVWQ